MKRSSINNFAFSVLLPLLCLLVAVAIFGCDGLKRPARPAPQPSPEIVKAGGSVKAASGEIRKSAEAGQAATPPDVLPILSRYWTAILTQCGVLEVAAGQLDTLGGQVKQVEGRLKTEEARSAKFERTIAENDERHAKELAKANSATKKMFDRLAWLAAIAIGVSVAAGVITKRASVAVAGVAGGSALLAVSLVTKEILVMLPILAGWLLGICAVWIVGEWAIRWKKSGNAWEALKKTLTTDPITDIRELAGGATSGG